MNYALANTIVDLIAARDDAPCGAELARFGLGDWQRSMFWLDASGLALLFEERIRRQQLSGFIPASIQARLRRAADHNQQRTQAMLAEFARLVAALEEARIQFAVLKGFSLVPDYCSNPALRLQVDFDFLLRPEQMDNVAAVMQRLKYRLVSRLPFEVQFASGNPAPRPHSELYLPPSSFTVEFHFSLIDRPELSMPSRADALQRRRWSGQLGLNFPVLAEDDQFIHHTMHTFQDIFLFSLRISSLMETRDFLRAKQYDDAFWRQVRGRCAEWDVQMASKLALVLALSVEVCRSGTPAALRAWTIATCSQRILLWVRCYGRRWCLHPFPGSKLSLFVAREFMDARHWSRYAWRSILPVPSTTRSRRNQATRPAQRNRPWKYLGVRAWFHLREAARVAFELPRWAWALRSLQPRL
jgi:putative nucleotidyltransferase-like protein